jgi:hypothetical protein
MKMCLKNCLLYVNNFIVWHTTEIVTTAFNHMTTNKISITKNCQTSDIPTVDAVALVIFRMYPLTASPPMSAV